MRWTRWRLDSGWLPGGAVDPSDHDDVCMCGSSMAEHSVYDNHGAVSAADYYRGKRRDEITEAFSPASTIVDEWLGVR